MARPRSEETRNSILEFSIQVFGERGFKSTTIKEIADRAEISPGSVYNYFQDKEDLFRCAVEEGWQQFLTEIKGIITAPGLLEERFVTILDFCFETLKDALPLLRGMLFEAHQRHLLHENLEKLCRLLEGLTEEAQKKGLIPGSIDRATLRMRIKIMVYGILSATALSRDQGLTEEIGRLKSTLIRMLHIQRN